MFYNRKIMETHNNINNIIAKKLAGEASTEELGELQHWIDADPANQLEYTRLADLWREIRKVPGEFDTNKAWLKVNSQIKNAKDEVTDKRSRVIHIFSGRRFASAAAILLIIACTWYLLSIPSEVKWETLTAANNKNIVLPDGSTVWLRKGSTVKWIADFNKNRALQLSGEAFFDVKHVEGKEFSISTDHLIIKVIGTAFSIQSLKGKNKVVVVRGKVEVNNKAQEEGKIILAAGEELVSAPDEFQKSKVSDSNYLSWKTGHLDFKDAPLKKVLEDVSDYYQVPITVNSNNIAEQTHITVRFDKEPIKEVLTEISLITNLEIKKQGDSLVFYKK